MTPKSWSAIRRKCAARRVFVFSNLKAGRGHDLIVRFIESDGLFFSAVLSAEGARGGIMSRRPAQELFRFSVGA